MKKKIFALALAVVLIAVAGYQTLAYFTAADSATNKITADTLTIRVNEYQTGSETPVAEGQNGITINVADVVPGDTVSKIPKVENLENNADAWIRVRVTVICTAADGETSLSTAPISLNYDTAAWTLNGGIYYYNTIVPADTETSALFTGVSFDLEDMDNTYQGAAVTILLEAQAVQSDNNGATVLAAAGWPSF